MVINPITWTRSETTATASQNLGSISLDKNGYAVLDAQGQPKRALGVADARIDTASGELICSTADTATLDPGNGMVSVGIFHNYDYPSTTSTSGPTQQTGLSATWPTDRGGQTCVSGLLEWH